MLRMVFAMPQAAAGQAGTKTGFPPAELLIPTSNVQEMEGEKVLTRAYGWAEVGT